MTDFSFAGSFNMGYEGFSRPLALQRQHPVYGGKGEWLALLGLLTLIPLIRGARKKNEDALRNENRATNRYEVLQLEHSARQPSKWTI